MTVDFKQLQGKTLTDVERVITKWNEDEIWFYCDDGTVYKQCHIRDCCEQVHIEDINGDLKKLVGYPIIVAEERSNRFSGGQGTQTWTFYKIRNHGEDVTIRWCGESNGHYSEDVDFIKVQ